MHGGHREKKHSQTRNIAALEYAWGSGKGLVLVPPLGTEGIGALLLDTHHRNDAL
jgi:hypothetical protein